MTERTPPKLAAALLRWFGPHGPALAGDLLERFQSGQSRWWYWRQVVAAVLIGAWRDSRTHQLASIWTCIGGIVCIAVADRTVRLVGSWLMYRVLQPLAWQQPFVASHPFVVLWLANVIPFAVSVVVSSWIVGSFGRSRPALKMIFLSTVFVSLLSFWTFQLVQALSRPGRHWPLLYMVAFAVGQVLLPTVLTLMAAMYSAHLNRPQLMGPRAAERPKLVPPN